MKHGKAPTAAQKKLIKEWGLDPGMWLVVKNQPESMTVTHRYGSNVRIIPKVRPWRDEEEE